MVGIGFDDVQGFEETHNRIFVKGCPNRQPLSDFISNIKASLGSLSPLLTWIFVTVPLMGARILLCIFHGFQGDKANLQL